MFAWYCMAYLFSVLLIIINKKVIRVIYNFVGYLSITLPNYYFFQNKIVKIVLVVIWPNFFFYESEYVKVFCYFTFWLLLTHFFKIPIQKIELSKKYSN